MSAIPARPTMEGFLGGHEVYVTGTWKRAWEDILPWSPFLAVDAESSD